MTLERDAQTARCVIRDVCSKVSLCHHQSCSYSRYQVLLLVVKKSECGSILTWKGITRQQRFYSPASGGPGSSHAIPPSSSVSISSRRGTDLTPSTRKLPSMYFDGRDAVCRFLQPNSERRFLASVRDTWHPASRTSLHPHLVLSRSYKDIKLTEHRRRREIR